MSEPMDVVMELVEFNPIDLVYDTPTPITLDLYYSFTDECYEIVSGIITRKGNIYTFIYQSQLGPITRVFRYYNNESKIFLNKVGSFSGAKLVS